MQGLGVTQTKHSRYNEISMNTRTKCGFALPAANDCWLHFLVCPRRYLAVLPAHTRPNLFSGD